MSKYLNKHQEIMGGGGGLLLTQCPKCNGQISIKKLLIDKGTKFGGAYITCQNKNCDYYKEKIIGTMGENKESVVKKLIKKWEKYNGKVSLNDNMNVLKDRDYDEEVNITIGEILC